MRLGGRAKRSVLATMLAGVLLAIGGANPSIALAHAYMIRGSPVPDSIEVGSPSAVHLWFSEDLNGSASQILVWDRFRHNQAVGHARLVPGQSRQLEVDLHPLSPGSYLVLWTSVSSLDGHVLHGAYSFSVQHRGPLPSLTGVSFGGTAQQFPDTTTLESIVVHWLELAGAVSWVGSVFFSAFVLAFFAGRMEHTIVNAEALRLRRFLQITLTVLLLASTLSLGLTARSLAGGWPAALSGDTLGGLFAGQFAQFWIVRQSLALAALALTLDPIAFRLSRRMGGGTWNLWPAILSLLGFVYLYFLAASGHASSAQIGSILGGRIVSGSIAVDWLHLIGSSLWLGGQIYIVAVLAPALRLQKELRARHAGVFLSALNRFSPVAYASIAFFTFSGGFNGKVLIPSWYAFFHSVYGWALLVKISLIGCMMLVSVVTVYGLRPRLRRALGTAQQGVQSGSAILMDSLLRWLRAGPALGAGVLLATSVMFYYPVPVGLAPPPPSSYTAQGGGLTATLSLTPARAGPNVFTVHLRDGAGKPVSQAHLVILTTMLDMVMGTGLISLNPSGRGFYKGSGDLGMGGHWRWQILVYHGSTLTRINVDGRVET